MFDRDNWIEIFHTLGKNRFRTFLTAFGVGWGIFMLLIMLAAGSGLHNGASRAMMDNASNSFWVWTQGTSIAYKGLPRNRRLRMTTDDAKAIELAVPELEVVAPRAQLGGWRGGKNVSHDGKTGAFEIDGDIPRHRDISLIQMDKGRYINDKDMEEYRKVCTIGKRAVEILFEEDEDPIGEYILINGVYFQVVGTHVTTKDGGQGEREEQSIYIPLTTFQRAFNFGNRIGWFAMMGKEGMDSEATEEKVLKILRERHSVHPDDKRAFGHANASREFSQIQNVLTGIEVLSWFVGVFTLLAGVIGVSNIMLVTVKERTKEIGVKRAIGAPPRLIVFQIVVESMILTSVAGYIGMLLGFLIIELFASNISVNFFRNPHVDLNVVLTAMGVLTVAGVIAGMMPASRALRIKPVEAIRTE